MLPDLTDILTPLQGSPCSLNISIQAAVIQNRRHPTVTKVKTLLNEYWIQICKVLSLSNLKVKVKKSVEQTGYIWASIYQLMWRINFFEKRNCRRKPCLVQRWHISPSESNKLMQWGWWGWLWIWCNKDDDEEDAWISGWAFKCACLTKGWRLLLEACPVNTNTRPPWIQCRWYKYKYVQPHKYNTFKTHASKYKAKM